MNDQIPIRLGPINRPTTVNVSGFVRRDGCLFMSDDTRELIARIVTAVCAAFGVAEEALISKARPERLAWPRQIAMSLCYQPPAVSLNDVGSHFGGRDHSTVLHAVQRVKARCETDPKSLAEFERVKGMVR